MSVEAAPVTMTLEDGKWVLHGLCDACKKPYQGGAHETTVKVIEGPMMTRVQKLTVCYDILACNKAFMKLIDTNSRLRAQGRGAPLRSN